MIDWFYAVLSLLDPLCYFFGNGAPRLSMLFFLTIGEAHIYGWFFDSEFM